jgi:hypothetical protein
MATPTLVGSAVGFPAAYGQHIQNAWSNQQGDKVYVNPTAGNCLVAVVFGLRHFDPFDLLHTGNTNFAYSADLLSFNAAPTISDSSSEVATISNIAETAGNVVTLTVSASFFSTGQSVALAGLTTGTWLNGHTVTLTSATSTSLVFTDPTSHGLQASHAETGTATEVGGNVWSSAAGQVALGDSDYTVSSVPPTAPNPWPSVQWALDGRFPSVYIFYALNVQAGPYYVDVNSMFQSGITRPADYASGGLPIFDGGVDIHVFELSGIVATAATDGSTGAMSAANPAVAGSGYTTTTAGDAIITAGLMKSGNVFSSYAPAGTTGTTIVAVGKTVSTQAHWAVQFQLQTANGLIVPGFTNPYQYEMAVASVALKHS